MKPFNTFYFESYRFDQTTLKATFRYSFDESVYFEEKIDFASEDFKLRGTLDDAAIEAMLFQLSLALGISYYKLCPTKQLVVKTGFLDEEQCCFWNTFYTHGLGEFFYKNKISPEGLCQFVSVSDEKKICSSFVTQERSLVPLGGGKDSIVTIEMLKQKSVSFDTVVFGKMDVVKTDTSKQTGVQNLCISRKLSAKLIEMNQEGYYNGHVPITGIISFVLIFAAYLYDYRYIVLSNERSANFGNTIYEGLEVNHQYSKSLQYEQDLQEYLEKSIGGSISYFSLLRPMYEIKIAKLFSELGTKYFHDFSSCNKNFKITETSDHQGRWCNACPKCLFVYAILRPYLGERIIEIFGKDLYDDIALEASFKELAGLSGIKPFECVGEEIEVVFAMHEAIGQYRKTNQELPPVLYHLERGIQKKMKWVSVNNLKKNLFKNYNEHILPESFERLLKKYD